MKEKKRPSIVYLDGIVTVRRTRGGYRLTVEHEGPRVRGSLFTAHEAIERDLGFDQVQPELLVMADNGRLDA